MRKIFATGLVFAVLLAVSMSVPALASLSYEDAVNHLENVDAHIRREIEKAQTFAAIALEQGDEAEIDAIIEDLLEKTADLSAKAMEWADRQGLNVESFFYYVEVGGRPVEVDPIHVLW